jgi:hypothetical protein
MMPAAPPPVYAPQASIPQPASFVPQNTQPARPQSPSLAATQPQRPIIRARVQDDDPPPRKQRSSEPAVLAMPSPEELGLAAPRQPDSDEIDWPLVHNRLQQQGAVCSQRLQIQEGFRFIVILSTADKDRMQRIEADASTEAAAVRAAMAKVAELRK